MLAPGSSVHIVGVGGAGMSALAQLLVERGCRVSGCDARDSDALRQLRSYGVATTVGHDVAHVANVDTVTASPAIAATADELVAARDQGIAVVSRAEVMRGIGRDAPLVGFAGTHGKTTATSMAVAVWRAAGADPGWLVGAPVVGVGGGGHWRDGGDLLTELDESFGTFSLVSPAALGILAVDPDHLDFYGDVATLERAYADVVTRTHGPVVVWVDNPGAATLVAEVDREVVRVGRGDGVDWRVTDEKFAATGSSFRLTSRRESFELTLRVPGAFNVANAAVVAAVAQSRGIATSAIVAGLAQFPGAPRRFEVRGHSRGTTLVDDYAHLPGEVHATIDAARAAGFQKIAAVFQPHRVTRTVALAPEFTNAFDGVTTLVVTDLYTSGEPNPDGVTGELIATAVRVGARAPLVAYTPTLSEAATTAAQWVGSYDLILILGAGDVADVANQLAATFAS